MRMVSVFAMPIFMAVFIVYGMVKKVGVYDCFIEGAKEGAEGAVKILPSLIGLMVAINMFRQSGAFELLGTVLSAPLTRAGIPADVLPLALLRPISGSASLALVTDIFQIHGPDSAAGKLASVMMGSTETTFYTIAVYFGSAGIKNTRHTLPSALSADLTGIILSAVICRAFLC